MLGKYNYKLQLDICGQISGVLKDIIKTDFI